MDQRIAITELPQGVIASAFARALAAAEAFLGATAPNPPVGAAVLDETGEVLAVAAHERAGQAHAEAKALAACRAAQTIDRAHTIVVTLEPCNHTGRTPPCCDAILASRISHVWIGSRDPNRAVKGGGAERLRDAGLVVRDIAAISPDLFRQSETLLAPFAKRARTGLPWVTVKQALDEQGSMIPPAGAKTFTSPASLLLAHQLRKRADAIITGSGTVLADAPHFTVRHVPDHAGKRRLLIVLDRRRRAGRDWIAASESRGFDVAIADSFEEALALAARRGALEVLVEAGPSLTQHVLGSDKWDEIYTIHKNGNGPGEDRVDVRLRQEKRG
jgi:diaminohydroxyphosphoribosylaminopyrimidine deaminase/5-amino-6-(5-phosphoribosylamino)uracil reductase